MTLKFLLRLVDNLFRHPIRYLIPIVLLAGYGFATLSTDDEYSSTGVVLVEDDSFLSSITDVGGSDARAFSNPADIAVDKLFGLIGTDSFATEVIQRINGADETATYDDSTLVWLRRNIGISSSPGSLLEVTGFSVDPLTAQASAQGVIDAYIAWQIEADLAQSQTAETFLAELVVVREAELASAQEALRNFLLLNPDPEDSSSRSTAEELALDELELEVTAARERYDRSLQDVELAQLATSQTEVDTRVNLRVVDSPALPTAPESRLVSNALRVILFAILGAGASLGVLVVTTFTDTSIRFPAEVRDRLGKEPLAVIPRVQ